MSAIEKQVTSQPHGHILTNAGVWSPDGRWIVYDVRSDTAGTRFDGTRIERVDIQTGEMQLLYASKNGACVGAASCNPKDDRVVFMHGPENPTPGWEYSFHNRFGAIVHAHETGVANALDARDLVAPFTAGALRGGTHLHAFSPDGGWIAFTYDDDRDANQRNIGISAPSGRVTVNEDHPRNYAGSHFSVLVTRTTSKPQPGSDEIGRAAEEAWVGTNGYIKPDGKRQQRALAFQGTVVTEKGAPTSEVFIVDLPEDVTVPGDGPLQGTENRRPFPPRGTVQRRLSFTGDRPHPGLQGPRHWLRSNPDGSRIAFLMKDDNGIVQIWTVSPNGGEPMQLTHNCWDIASAFTWSADGKTIAHVMDNSVCVTTAATGQTDRLTQRSSDAMAPRPEACVISPDGSKIAYVKRVLTKGQETNQLFVLEIGTPG